MASLAMISTGYPSVDMFMYVVALEGYYKIMVSVNIYKINLKITELLRCYWQSTMELLTEA
jgi:hypothetical protein